MYEEISPADEDAIYQASPSVITIGDPESPTAESLRALRTQLVASGDRERSVILAVCGPTAGVGTTFVAVNLAVAIAQTGSRVLLVDADLREPGVDRMILPPVAQPGLGDWLSGEGSLGDLIVQDVIPNLSVLYAGAVLSNAQELLAQSRFDEFVHMCAREYDFTVIDTPPGDRFADSRYISSVVGAALIVARKDVTAVDDLKALSKELGQHGAEVLGVVLNEY